MQLPEATSRGDKTASSLSNVEAEDDLPKCKPQCLTVCVLVICISKSHGLVQVHC